MERQFDQTEGQDQADKEKSRALSANAQPKIQGYEVHRKLGAGTFGEVWLARQQSTGQEVAVKLLTTASTGWAHKSAEMERLRSASKHPNIVDLLDADLQSDPPYIVMSLMKLSLTDIEKPTVTQVETWFGQMAAALHFIHQRGLLHCDLKPSNVLLDETGQARIADFGQSVSLEQETGALGSLGYMPAEQASNPQSPQVGWDIYSLGATVYRLLTGQLPYLSQEDLRELMSVDDSTTRLTEYCGLLKRGELSPIRSLNPDVDASFASIVEGCLKSDISRTSQMAEVTDDLRRRRDGEPLLCHRPWSRSYLLQRYLRRNLIAVVATLLVLAGLSGMGLLKYRKDTQMRGILAQQSRDKGLTLTEQGNGQEGLLWTAEALSYASEGLTARFEVEHFRPRLVGYFAHGSPADSVTFLGEDKVVTASDSALKVWTLAGNLQSEVSAPAVEQPTLSKPYVWPLNRLVTHEDLITGFLSNGLSTKPQSPTRLLGGGQGSFVFQRENEVALWVNGNERDLPLPSNVIRYSVSPDGRWLSGFTTTPPSVIIFNDNGDQVATHQLDSAINHLSFSPQSDKLVASCRDGSLRMLEAKNWSNNPDKLAASSWPVYATYFHPSEPLIYSCHYNGEIKAWRSDDASETLEFIVNHQWLVYGVVFDMNGHSFCSYSTDGTARVWNARNGKALTPFLQHKSPVRAASYSPAGDHLATTSIDGAVRVFKLHESMQAAWLRTFDSELAVTATHILKNNSILVSLGQLNLTGSTLSSTTPQGGAVGRLLCYQSGQAQAKWEVDISTPVTSLDCWEAGGLVVTSGQDGSLSVWDLENGGKVTQAKLPGSLAQVSISPSGKRVSAALYDGRAFLFGLQDDELTQLKELAPGGELRTAQTTHPVFAKFDLSSRILATALGDNQVRLWDGESGELLGSTTLPSPARKLAFHPDGELLGIVSDDGTAGLYNLQGELKVGPVRHGIGIWELAFAPDGHSFATASGDSTARIWSSDTGSPLLPALEHNGPVVRVLFSPDGRLLLTGSKDGRARLWDSQTGELMKVLLKAEAPVFALAFSEDNTLAVCGAADGRLTGSSIEFKSSTTPAAVKKSAQLATGLTLKFQSNGAAEVEVLTPEQWNGIKE